MEQLLVEDSVVVAGRALHPPVCMGGGFGNWLSAQAEAAEAVVLLGDPTHAQGLYDRLAPYAGRPATAGRAVFSYGAIDRHPGSLAPRARLIETAILTPPPAYGASRSTRPGRCTGPTGRELVHQHRRERNGSDRMVDTYAMTDIAAMKQQARTTWAAGDFDSVVPFIWEAGGVAAEAAGCRPGDRVLDIAAGSGNAAIQAAMRGADVVASDLTPELFEPGRRRAADNGVELEWVEADAEDLPFEDASFDVALSTFGIMFAPRQSVAAAELARVVKPGGRIALCSWRPAGFIGEMFRTIAGFLNPPPPPEGPPVRWGTEEGAHELLDDGFEIQCEERILIQRYAAGIDEMTDYFMPRFGPMVMARRALEPDGRWDEFLAAYRELTHRWNQGENGEAALPAAYLLVTGTCKD